MSALWRVLVNSWQESRLMIVEEQDDLLIITEACLNAIASQLTNGRSLVVVILLEAEWLLESQMRLCLMRSIISMGILHLVQLHRVHGLIIFEFDGCAEIEVFTQFKGDSMRDDWHIPLRATGEIINPQHLRESVNTVVIEV